MNRVTLCIGLLGALALRGADDNAGGRMVAVGDHRLFMVCSGPASKGTVVLLNGLGAGFELWKAVQAGVEGFSRVCSYDRAGEGHSERIGRLQTPEEVVTDLRRLLDAEKVHDPYVLVGASLGGVYVRKFTERYPELTAAIVFVDSSHEEQYNHLAAISPSLAERYATQDGRFQREEFLRSAGQLKTGEHLQWHLDVPLVVLEHKRLKAPPQTDPELYDARLHEMQADLAARSRFGRLVETQSGHLIAAQQPEVVVESIREVIRQAEAMGRWAGGPPAKPVRKE